MRLTPPSPPSRIIAPRSNSVPRRGFQTLLLVSVLALAPETVEAQGAVPGFNINAAHIGESVGVSWEGASDADGYRIEWKSGSQSYDSSRRSNQSGQSSLTRSILIQGLTGGVEYTFRMQARKGNSGGAWTDEKTAKVFHPKPGKVSNLRVTGVAGNMVWRWNAVSNASNYRFQWKAPGESYSSSRQRDYTSATTSVNDRRSNIFTPGLTYTFRVRAMRTGAALDGAWSSEVELLVGAQTPPQVGPPTVMVRPGALEVSWPAGTDITSYLLQWKSGEQSYSSSRQITVPGTRTSATIENLDGDVEYSVQVIATREHASANAPASTEIMATPLAINPGVTVSETALTVSEPDGAATYTVVLETVPVSAVTVRPTSGDTGAARVWPPALFFTPNNWHTGQTVTVTAVSDNADNPDGQRATSITHKVAGYGRVAMDTPVRVTVRDGEDPTPVPALPLLWPAVLLMLLAAGGARRRLERR